MEHFAATHEIFLNDPYLRRPASGRGACPAMRNESANNGNGRNVAMISTWGWHRKGYETIGASV